MVKKRTFLLFGMILLIALVCWFLAVLYEKTILKEQGTAEEKIQLHIWGNQGLQQGFDSIINEFQKEYKKIQIIYHQYDASEEALNLRLETNLLSGGNDVDLYFTYTTQELSKRVRSGIALNLNQLCRRDGFDMEKNFTQNVSKFYYEQLPYAVPSTVGKMGIILNKDMFDEAGIEIPKDWDFEEFRQICKRLTKNSGNEKIYGMFWNTQANLSEALLHFVLPTLGGDPLYKKDGQESNMEDPVIYAALKLMEQTMHEDQSAPTHEESEIRKLSMENMFFQEKCAMTVGAWMFAEVIDKENYPHDFVTAYAPWPVIEKSRRNYVQGSFGGHLSINPKSKNVDAAWEFIKWYTTKGIFYNVPYGYTPCYTGFKEDEIEKALLFHTENVMDSKSTIEVLLNPDTNLSIPVIENKIDGVTELFDQAVEETLMQKTSAKEALRRAKEKADDLLAEK